ncbi:RNA polymerase sigma-70 factor [Halalkalibacter wakoensis JCM 9140]|uniref:RNA polymerase sigma-70 factor n=1 Tax=Halalkalibacter wakoensis JCM 9140 TaxID=1236970 RepID=W4Q6X7_9BACI|nr:sigma-70 family RNA polymerase sigma factor [Halalkalibacter wakoensis]GAE27725.1 RNA polymerase sigma-70 factor [Halalkalibacter wakoensis JCM 9140]
MTKLEQTAIHDESIEEDREHLINLLMDEHSDEILHLVFTYVNNQTTAEDLTQEIFIKCYEKLHQFNEQSSIKTWLFRIAINHCKDYLKSWHYRKISLHEKIWDSLPSNTKQVDEELIAKTEEERLAHAVIALPVKYREVIYLHYYQELSLVEISKVTAVNLNTIKTRMKRAKELVKDQIIEEVE